MANNFLSPSLIAGTALALLRREVVLPATVYRDARNGAGDAKIGNTINVRKPATAVAREYSDALRTAGTPIVVDDLAETSIPVVIDKHIYHAAAVTDEDLTLKIEDFAAQVLAPQVLAVGNATEDRLAAEMNALASQVSIAAGGADVHAKIIEARRRLNTANVPQGSRYLAVSPDVEAFLLNDPQNRLVRYEASGDAGNSALREATIGRLYGFEVVVSTALAAGTALAYSSDAFAMVMVAPVKPDGATFGQQVTDRGMAMRWLRDYDAAFTRDRSIVSIFAGAKLLDATRVVKLTTAA